MNTDQFHQHFAVKQKPKTNHKAIAHPIGYNLRSTSPQKLTRCSATHQPLLQSYMATSATPLGYLSM